MYPTTTLLFSILLVLLFITLIFSFSLLLKSIYPIAFWGAIFVPSNNKKINQIIKLSKVKPNQKVADLGSGDGRLVIAFAHSGAKVHGFEINPLLIQKSRTNIKKAKLENKAQIHLKSFWTANLSQYDIIYIYGMQHIMKRLEKKLQKELKPGAKIISNVYKFPNWPIKKQTNHIYLYQK